MAKLQHGRPGVASVPEKFTSFFGWIKCSVEKLQRKRKEDAALGLKTIPDRNGWEGRKSKCFNDYRTNRENDDGSALLALNLLYQE
ncbi:MAG: hypothetical protein H0S85_00295 [Desulfovibrionaceae bacterium]|nr:hypothetical protein [Desulfovibrionaceae bacterium]